MQVYNKPIDHDPLDRCRCVSMGIGMGTGTGTVRTINCLKDFASRNEQRTRPLGQQATHILDALQVNNLSTTNWLSQENASRKCSASWQLGRRWSALADATGGENRQFSNLLGINIYSYSNGNVWGYCANHSYTARDHKLSFLDDLYIADISSPSLKGLFHSRTRYILGRLFHNSHIITIKRESYHLRWKRPNEMLDNHED